MKEYFKNLGVSILLNKEYLNTPQRITISITRQFVSCNFSMDQLDLTIFGGDDLSFDTYLS